MTTTELEKPESPSDSVRIPVITNKISTDKATMSERIFPQTKKTIANKMIAKTIKICVSIINNIYRVYREFAA